MARISMISHLPRIRRWTGPRARIYERLGGLGLAAALLGALWGCPPAPQPTPPAAPTPEKLETFPNPYVRGFISTVPGVRGVQELAPVESGGPIGIYLPAVTVVLRDARTNEDIGKTQTDLSGRYNFPQVANGSYVICWEMRGFLPGCTTRRFTMDGRPMLHPLIRLAPDLRAYPLFVFGNVRLRDGELRTFEPLMSLNVFARVRARPVDGAPLDSAFVNTHGDYVLPLRSNRDNVRLEGVLEALTETATLSGEMLRRVGTSHRADLVLNNNRPRPHLVTLVGGRNVRSAAPGATVRLEARGEDMDGDALQFRWILPERAGTLSATIGPAVEWRLPNARGLHHVQVLVGDGKGGYAKIEASVTTEPGGLGFSGTVDATDAPAVANALVEVNGDTTRTNASGFFSLSVRDSSRYVLNITKPGYNLVSRIYQEPVLTGHWTLTRGTTVSVDPNQPIDITDGRRAQRCRGPASSRIDWDRFREASRARLIDPRSGRVAATRDGLPAELRERQTTRECGPGARVRIPAGALVDANGNAPPGNVDVTLFTVDLRSPDDMPGDYTARDAQGRERVMESYGAASVSVYSGTTEYNLRAGDSATITIPIDPAQLAAPAPEPGTIPLLRYDRTAGIWRTIGSMNRVGDSYEAKVGRFSEFNADQLKQQQSCIQIHSPQSGSGFAGLPASYRIEFTIPQGNAAPYVIDRLVINNVPYHVLYNLPNTTNVVMVPYDPTTLKPYGTFVVNSGGTQDDPATNPPNYDYSACQGEVTLYDVAEPALGSDAFLHGLYSFESVNLNDISDADSALWDAATLDYYQQVDPRRLRATLDSFKIRNDFPTGEIRAIYANSADLGFGRDMHCVRKPATDGLDDDVACYVSNYGDALTPDSADFVAAVQDNGLVATVAMEYSRIENDDTVAAEYTDPDRVVKFFVYGANGNRINAADLDKRGARPIPQLCLVCHSGTTGGTGIEAFPDRASVKLGSRFIAFDLSAYRIVDGINAAFNKAAQQPEFKQLNQDIVQGTSPGIPIVELIDSMYLGGVADQREDFSILGWNDNAARQSMYEHVLGPACRMCHASQPQSNLLGKDIRFNHAQPFINLGSLVPQRVCIEHVMPHARVTHDSLWASLAPHRPAQIQSFGDTQVPSGYGTVCGAPSVTAPTPTVPTYDAQMGSFFNTRCSGCHTGPKQPVTKNDACTNGFAVMGNLLDLTTANGYTSIVNQTSVEASPMKLVTPGDTLQSYLWHKVKGTYLVAPANGCGAQMPFGSSLSAAELQQVRDWIQGGALKN